MKLASKLVLAAAAVAVSAPLASASVILAQWNFNQSASMPVPNPYPTAVGSGTLSLIGGVTVTLASGTANGGSTDPVNTTPPNYGYNVTTFPAQGTNDRTAGIQALVSTVGYLDIQLRWDQRHSNTAARHVQVQYTIDGVNFTDIGPLFVGTAGDTWFNGRSVDFSAVPGVDNNPNFGIRIVSAFDPGLGNAYVPSNSTSTYASGGTWRFDMLTISGTVIPEPATLGLLAPAVLVLGRRRK
ncbi:MAG: PEP-CTERM sorting domain-containing protein [Tepidisphaerales bacterium]